MFIFSGLGLAAKSSAKQPTIRQTITSIFKEHSAIAICVSWNESHWKPYAVSPWGDHGLFQIKKSIWDGTTVRYKNKSMKINFRWIYHPRYNTRVAWFISRGGTNWHPWTAYNVGLC